MTPHGPIRREQGLRNSGAAGPHGNDAPRSQVERAIVSEQLAEMCMWHGVIEPLRPDDFWWCDECGHVWRTREDFDTSVAVLDAECRKFDRREYETNPRELPYCPLCAHDWSP